MSTHRPELTAKLTSLVNRCGGDMYFAENMLFWPKAIRRLVESSNDLMERFSIPRKGIEDVRSVGDSMYFEYHCEESDMSQDAELWYRSQRIVTITGFAANDGWCIPTLRERCELGHPIVYAVKFPDGFLGHAFEDELLDTTEEYTRPAPPLKVSV